MPPVLNNTAPTGLQEVRSKSRIATDHGLSEVAGLKRTPHSHHFESLRGFADLLFAFMTTSVVINYLGNLGRNQWGIVSGNLDSQSYAVLLLLYPILIVVCCHQQRMYRRFPNIGILEDMHALVKSVGLASLFLAALCFIRQVKALSPGLFTTVVIANVAALLVWRIIGRKIYGRQVALGKAGINVLIIGAGRQGRSLADYLQKNHHLGYVVKGFLDENRSSYPLTLGRISDLPRIAREEYVDEIFITIPARDELAAQTILTARKFCLDVTVVPELFDGFGFQAPLEYVGEFPVMELHREPIPTTGLVIKRLLDVFLAILALTVGIPVMAILAVCIYVDSPGPIFYTSQRVGKKGRTFGFYKMRSMVTNAESLLTDLEEFNEREGLLFKMEKDPRVTAVGRFLRKYSLDELPQLWNVLKGDMSLVGPRPPLVAEYSLYRLEHKRRLDVVPGITGLWQVSNRHDPSFESYLSQDLKYIENWNLWLDIEILLRTVPAVLRGTGY